MSRRTADSNTYRFFVPAEVITGTAVTITEHGLVHQLGGVLRLGAGQVVTLLDDSGQAFTVELQQVTKHAVHGIVTDQTTAAGEPALHLSLYVALLRSERFEWVLQKGTELGVYTFVPLICERNVVDAGQTATKQERWERILREAAEQARRGHLPRITPPQPAAAAFATAMAAGPAALLWEGQGGQPLRHLLQTPATTWSLFSGPEGGWSERELHAARNVGLPLASLGPRTLRAETAPLVAATAVLLASGDLD